MSRVLTEGRKWQLIYPNLLRQDIQHDKDQRGKTAVSFCHQVAAWVLDMFLQLLFSEKSQNC
jgi:hypothetical protein